MVQCIFYRIQIKTSENYCSVTEFYQNRIRDN